MHIGGLTIVEGPAADDATSSSSRSVGACTWCPATATSSPTRRSTAAARVWIDDPDFNLEYHIRHSALPAPGGMDQLQDAHGPHLLPAARPNQAAVGDVADRGPRGQPLRVDHQDPPLADRRHRGRRPGDGAVRPLPRSAARCRGRGGLATPPRAGRRLALLAAGARGAIRDRRSSLVEGALAAFAHPERALASPAKQPRASARSSGPVSTRRRKPAERADRPPPAVRRRRPAELEDFKTVKNAFGGTVNDVVLAGRGGRRCRSWLISRGRRTEGVEMRALVPVSVRHEHEHERRGQPHRGDARARCRSTSPTRSTGCGSSPMRWTA